MSKILCDQCRERAATVFVTKIVEQYTSQQHLCEVCARERALRGDWMSDPAISQGFESSTDTPLDEIIMNLFNANGLFFGGAGDDENEMPVWGANADMDDLDEDEAPQDEMEGEATDSDPFGIVPSIPLPEDGIESANGNAFDDIFGPGRGFYSGRCSKCDTTWDRLKQDGRAGCSQCYSTFREQLTEVMERLQKGEVHVGKKPRARVARKRRLEHLRARRDHRLEMLNRRLSEAIAQERYEEAAKLRDKIRVVASTIVQADTV